MWYVLHALRVRPTSVARWVSEAKTIKYRFSIAVSPKVREGRAEQAQAIAHDTRRRRGYVRTAVLGKALQILVPFPKHSRLSNKTSLILASPCFGYTFEKTVHRTVFSSLTPQPKNKTPIEWRMLLLLSVFSFLSQISFRKRQNGIVEI